MTATATQLHPPRSLIRAVVLVVLHQNAGDLIDIHERSIEVLARGQFAEPSSEDIAFALRRLIANDLADVDHDRSPYRFKLIAAGYADIAEHRARLAALSVEDTALTIAQSLACPDELLDDVDDDDIDDDTGEYDYVPQEVDDDEGDDS